MISTPCISALISLAQKFRSCPTSVGKVLVDMFITYKHNADYYKNRNNGHQHT